LPILASQILGDDSYLQTALAQGDRALDSLSKGYPFRCGYSSNLEDTSLMMGNAGIGYELMRMAMPELVQSVLLPTLDHIQYYCGSQDSSESLARLVLFAKLPLQVTALEAAGASWNVLPCLRHP